MDQKAVLQWLPHSSVKLLDKLPYGHSDIGSMSQHGALYVVVKQRLPNSIGSCFFKSWRELLFAIVPDMHLLPLWKARIPSTCKWQLAWYTFASGSFQTLLLCRWGRRLCLCLLSFAGKSLAYGCETLGCSQPAKFPSFHPFPFNDMSAVPKTVSS